MCARVMLFGWLAAMVAAGAVVGAEPQHETQSVSAVRSPHRSLSAIGRDVHEALRAEALSRRLGENAAEVVRLVELYREMAAHPRRDESDFIKGLGLKLRSRLKKVRDHIERRSTAAERPAKKKQAVSDLVVPATHVLAQQVAVPGGAGLGAQPAAAQAGAAQPIDYGPDLVEVIQQTISPATWDINGGNGSVVYFAPLRVLVVSAPGTVHGEIGDVLGQLRAAP